jgi:hypothetical protein
MGSNKEREKILQGKGIQEAVVSKYLRGGAEARPYLQAHITTTRVFAIADREVQGLSGSQNFYMNTSSDSMLHPVPLHRKFKLSSLVNRKKEDDRLAKSIAQGLVKTALVMRTWSATT